MSHEDLNNYISRNHYQCFNRCFSQLFPHLQCLEKVFIPLKLFHILSRYKHKLKCILLGFHVIDQHKVVHNCEVGEK